MSSVSFSLGDYTAGLSAGRYAPPTALCPYYEVDPMLYRRHGDTKQRRGNLRRALEELHKRTGRVYFDKIYPLQARTLDYSARSFPAYRFILPEVMTEDWLAIVDWGKFQRDHVLHQPLCGYVMLKLLDVNDPLRLPDGKTLLETCVDHILSWKGTKYIRDFLIGCGLSEEDPILQAGNPIAHTVWQIFFREAAYVAAVFHDLGYPWQYAERIQANLDGMNAPTLRQNRSAAQVVNLFGHRMLFHVLRGYRTQDAAYPSHWNDKITLLTDTALTKTHGLPGALGFLHLNDCVRRYPSKCESPLHLLCIEWAAAAIMMHDMSKIYWGKGEAGSGTPENPFLRLKFDRDPLSAIVTLADIIQDFERPTASFETCTNSDAKQWVTLSYKEACLGAELWIDGCSMTIQFSMVNEESRAIKRKSLHQEEREIFDAQYGYLDVSSLGINHVQVLAC